jgi:hypothetical protein
MKDITSKVEGLITKEPLILIYSSLELLLILSKLREDYTCLVSLFMKCLVFLQSQNAALSLGKKLESDMLLSMSRSILICSYTLYLKNMHGLEKELEVDISAETLSTLRGLVTSPKLD